MANINVHFSSDSSEWETPQDFYDRLNKKFNFNLDPCASPVNAKCKKFYSRKENGLMQDWGDSVVFMNPPYGREIKLWMEKAYKSSLCGATVVCLVPSRTDTIWWHDYAMKGEIEFIKGRLKFGGHKTSAPFPSAIVIFRPFGD